MFTESIEGDGLRLRLLTPDDSPTLLAFWNLPEVVEPTSSEGWTAESMAAFLAENVAGAARGDWCRYAILLPGGDAPVGTVGLFHSDPCNRRAEIGYDLSPEWWGQGLMVRAANLLIGWAFAHGFHRIEATVMAGNLRSERVLQKLGFEREGMMRDYKLVRGEWCAYSLWGRVSSGWQGEGEGGSHAFGPSRPSVPDVSAL